jgi:hypothetical protein
MAMATFETNDQKFQFDSEVYFKLKEAELEAEQTTQRFSHQEVFAGLKKTLQAKAENSAG